MRQAGFSLIEAMVVILIALFLSLAISSVMSTNEAFKRTTGATADASQNGNFAVYVLDKAIRNGGSGFRQALATAYGCPVTAYYQGTQRLPISAGGSALPAQFQQLNSDLAGIYVMAPVLIDKNGSPTGTSDALVVMSGSSGYGEFPYAFSATPPAGGGSLVLTTTVGYKPSDILLVTQTAAVAGGVPACALEQVASTYSAATDGVSTTVPIAGDYYSPNVGGTTIPNLAVNSYAMDLGNEFSDSPPSFQLFAVGYSSAGSQEPSLFGYDLLQIGTTVGATQSTAIADGVYEMHAVYGVASSTACTGAGGVTIPCPITSWVDPGVAPWDIKTLTNQNNANSNNAQLFEIKAVRVGLIMRSPLPEKTAVTSGSITLFNNLNPTYGSPYIKTFTAAESFYRYRTIEVTIPVRNNGIP
jgi:type IV pilus assembly protein PilW